MLWRLAFHLIFLFAPRLVPRAVRTAYLVWKLSFDRRVPLLLKLLVPGTLVYFVHPISRIPYLGLAGYLILLLIAVWILLNLAPGHVVEEYAPWRAAGRTAGRQDRGSAKVVEGTARLVDEEEPGK